MYVGGEKAERKLIVCDVRTEECNVGVKQSAQHWGQQEKERVRGKDGGKPIPSHQNVEINVVT